MSIVCVCVCVCVGPHSKILDPPLIPRSINIDKANKYDGIRLLALHIVVKYLKLR